MKKTIGHIVRKGKFKDKASENTMYSVDKVSERTHAAQKTQLYNY